MAPKPQPYPKCTRALNVDFVASSTGAGIDQNILEWWATDMVACQPPLSHAFREHLERLFNGHFHVQGSFYERV